MGRFFISHSSQDAKEAEELQRALGQGSYAFLDTAGEMGIQPGDRWSRRLFHELDLCDAIIVVLSPTYLDSKWCHTELAVALDRGKLLFWIETAPATERPDELNPVQGVKFVTSFAAGTEKLVAAIKRAGLLERADTALVPGRPPYPGLKPMEAEDSAVFFGREEAIRRLRDTLSFQATRPGGHLLVVLGDSGSGKSSLVRAGLTVRLRAEQETWVALTPFRPGLRPLDRLVACLVESAPAGVTDEECRSRLESAGLSDVLHWLFNERSKTQRRVVLTIDQAEELLGETSVEELATFLDILAEGLAADDSVLTLVLVLRSDRFADVDQLKGIAAHLPETFVLKPLAESEVTSVIVRPALLAGMKFEDELAERIAHDAVEESTTGIDALPLLAYTLRELYDDAERRQSQTMSAEKYRVLGGLGSAISGLAAMAESTLSEEVKKTRLEPLLVRFVSLDQGQTAISRPVPRAEVTDEDDLQVIKALEDAHLVTGDETLRLAHERLFSAWPTLEKVVEDNEAELHLRTRLQRQAKEYYEGKGGLIARPEVCREAESWLAQGVNPEPKDSDVAKYIRESGRSLRRKRRVREVAVGTVSAIAVVFLLLALFANSQRNTAQSEARDACSAGELSSQSAGFATSNIGLSAGLAMTASTLRDGADERSALIQATQQPLQSVLYDVSRTSSGAVAAVNTVAVSSDGSDVAGVDSGGNLFLVDGATSKVVDLRHTSSPIYAVAVSDDGKVVTGDRSGDLTLWQTKNLSAHRSLNQCGTTGPTPCKVVSSVAISRDGQEVAAGTYGDTLELCTTATLGVCTIVHTTNTVRAISYGPHGDVIATADAGGHVDLWSPSGVLIKSWQFRDGSPALAVAFSQDGTTVAAGDGGGRIVLWNVATGVQSEPFTLAPGQIIGLAWTDLGHVLVSADSVGATTLYDTTSDAAIARLPGDGASLRSVAATEDGQLVVTGDDEGHLTLWHSPLASTLLLADNNDLNSIAVDPSGLIIAGADNVGRVWVRGLLDPWAVSSKPIADHSTVNAVVFVDGGRDIVTGDNNGTVRLWSIASAQALHPYTVPEADPARQVHALAVDPVGATIAAAQASGHISLLGSNPPCPGGLSTDEQAASEADNLRALAINRDGTLLASGGSRGVVEVFSLTSCKALPSIAGDGSTILSLAYSPASDTLAVGDEQGEISLWHLHAQSRWRLATIKDGSAVDSLAFVQRGTILASADAAGSVTLRQVSNGATVARLPSDPNQVNSVAFDGPRNELLVADNLGYVHVYPGADSSASLPALRNQMCQEVNQGLSPQEWRQYVTNMSFVNVCATSGHEIGPRSAAHDSATSDSTS